MPGDVSNRVLGFLAPTWIRPHQSFEVSLRHFIHIQQKRLSQRDLVQCFIFVATWLSFSAAHHKLTRRNHHELHADAIGCLNRYAKMIGPCFLMHFGLCSVERGDGERRLKQSGGKCVLYVI